MRERTYWPELCVVQLGGEHETAVVDALAPDLDLAPLGALLADPKVVKVFHAARQDVEIFLLKFDAVPTPLFDTQVAAMVAGFGDQVSYDAALPPWPMPRSTRRTASPTGRPGRSRPRRSPMRRRMSPISAGSTWRSASGWSGRGGSTGWARKWRC